MFEFTRRPHSAALAFLVAGSVWFVVGTLYGLVSAIHLVNPEFFSNISWLVFGRSRPIHVNTVLFGFVTTTLIGAGLYYVPELLQTRLWSERLAWVGFLLWNLTILSGPFTFSFGITQGREYTEYIWIFDVTAELAFICLLIDCVMTVFRREEKSIYVSVWYFTATFIWTASFYPIGNVMWRPATGSVPGLLDSVFLWFYGHNLPGLLMTPLATGAAFFVIPRVAGVPLYSHTLSMIGFWTLVAFYSHIGGHHLLQAPIPNWLRTVSIVDSMAMVIPVYTVLANLWLTSREKGRAILSDPAARFVIVGGIWYLLVCTQGPIQSLPFIQQVTHFNNWTIGHAHIAVLGFSGFIALGALWHVLPLIAGRPLFSQKLVNVQFGFLTFGLMGFFLVLTTAGLIQGHSWYNGETVYRAIPQIAPYMVLRAALGLFIITSALIGLYNLLMTLRNTRVEVGSLATTLGETGGAA